MTPADRTEELLLKHWDFSLIRPEPLADIRKAIEQAITAAVEEERALLIRAAEKSAELAIDVAIKLEREACANILHEVYQAWVEGDYAPGEAFESAREKILHRKQ